MNVRMVLIPISAIFACLVAVAGVELTFELQDNDKQCFYENVPVNTSITLEFQVMGYYAFLYFPYVFPSSPGMTCCEFLLIVYQQSQTYFVHFFGYYNVGCFLAVKCKFLKLIL